MFWDDKAPVTMSNRSLQRAVSTSKFIIKIAGTVQNVRKVNYGAKVINGIVNFHTILTNSELK